MTRCPQHLRHTTSKITALARSGQINSARQLFDEMPHRDSIAWNAMISSYSQLGLPQEALKLFTLMRNSSARPDHFSFTASLSACADAGELRFGRRFHGLVIRFGYQVSLPVCNSLIDMYAKCSAPSEASGVFEEMGRRNEVSWCALLSGHVKVGDFETGCRVFYDMPNQIQVAWNILMAGYSRRGDAELCMGLFKRMNGSVYRPDQWTYVAVMNACSESEEHIHGRIVHVCIVKSGWSSVVEVKNAVLSYYAKFNCHEDTVKIFDSISFPTQVSWNTMIDAHMKMGFVDEALALFQGAPEKNMVSWTAMITGYARNGQGELAVCSFVDMTRNLHRPDDFTLGAVLHACSNLAVLGHGRMVHCCVVRYGFQAYAYVGNGLVNMYAKSGDPDGSFRAFSDIPYKDLVSWNALLFGFGLHGWVIEALKLYDDMTASGVKPDKVTFIGLLMACSHSGLIAQGQELFKSMSLIHGLTPEEDHVACMVDLFGRGGYLKQASDLIEEYAKTVKTSSREALLGACVAHGDVKLGKDVGVDVMLLDPEKEIGYMMLSNLYSTSGQWKEAETIRKIMKEKGVKKRPGCSWIQVGNKAVNFLAGCRSHPHTEQLFKLLIFLESEMRNPSFK